MKRIINTLLVVLLVSSFKLLAIDLKTDFSGMNLPANPLVAPEGKVVPHPKLNATQPMFILFDNFENPITSVISNYIELMFYDIYKKWPTADYNYYDLMVRAPFSDATLAQYNLTDFDVAIFPIGDYPLSVATTGGIKVIDKIKEMLDAGKRVMVMGRYWVTLAFNPSSPYKDPVVTDFLANSLGLDESNSGAIATISGNQYVPFHIQGVDGDIVSHGFDYYCNVGYGRNVPPVLPLVMRQTLDIFRLKTDAAATGIAYLDKLGVIDGAPNVETGIWTTLRAQVGDGKIVMFSLGPDVVALNESGFYILHEQYAMNWFTKDLPKAEQWLEFESSKIDWGETLIGAEKVREIRYRNFGKKPLTINKIYWEGFEDSGIFKIIEGGETGVLQPNEFKIIKVAFKPTEDREFTDNLIFESDAANGSTMAVVCTGIGGKDAPVGPEITVQTDPFDYGVVNIGSAPNKDIFFESTGTANLTVNSLDFVQNDDKCFSFTKQMNYPINVPAGDKSTFQVRFNPTTYGKKYTAKIKINSNAKINSTAYLTLIGSGQSASDGAIISASIDTLDLGRIKPLNAKTKSFNILNTGKQDLKIQLFYLTDDNDVFSVPSSIIDSVPLSIIPTALKEIPVTFKPWEDGLTYTADLGMFTNAANEGGNDFHVYFKGIGDNNGESVKNEVENKFGTLKLKAFPNPSGDNFTLEVTSKNTFFNASLNIYDLKGKVVSTIFKGNIEIGTNNYNLNNSGLASGQYFIGVQTATETVILPFIIVK